jgi:hypothetical protein
MVSWWHRDVIAAGKLPLMLCFLAFVVTFVATRTITRMIRDGRGPFRNQVTAGGTHIHHSVPGIILLIIGAITAIGGPGSVGWRSFAAVAVGTGTSLVLDEFALILHLQDVYWSGEGQLSIEAVSLTAACLGLGRRMERATRRAADFDRRWSPIQSFWDNFAGGKPSQPNPPAPHPDTADVPG